MSVGLIFQIFFCVLPSSASDSSMSIVKHLSLILHIRKSVEKSKSLTRSQKKFIYSMSFPDLLTLAKEWDGLTNLELIRAPRVELTLGKPLWLDWSKLFNRKLQYYWWKEGEFDTGEVNIIFPLNSIVVSGMHTKTTINKILYISTSNH